VHEAEADRLRRAHGVRDVVAWPMPVRTHVYKPESRAEARRRLGVADEAVVVFSAGRLHPIKGLHDLATACADLDCELVLAGAGSEEASLRARAQPRLRLLGRLDAVTLRDWYAAADVVALASRSEGMPVAVLEAQACGRAVVATRVGGVPELVRPGQTGWLVDPYDVARLRAALGEALADRGRADRYGAAACEQVRVQHSPDAAGAAPMKLLAEAQARSTRRPAPSGPPRSTTSPSTNAASTGNA